VTASALDRSSGIAARNWGCRLTGAALGPRAGPPAGARAARGIDAADDIRKGGFHTFGSTKTHLEKAVRDCLRACPAKTRPTRARTRATDTPDHIGLGTGARMATMRPRERGVTRASAGTACARSAPQKSGTAVRRGRRTAPSVLARKRPAPTRFSSRVDAFSRKCAVTARSPLWQAGVGSKARSDRDCQHRGDRPDGRARRGNDGPGRLKAKRSRESHRA